MSCPLRRHPFSPALSGKPERNIVPVSYTHLRRWHISLSTFFRDYVYIPLGGNRVSQLRHILNLLIVWALTGFWHGASWNFLLWGLYYFVFLVLEKYVFTDRFQRTDVSKRQV